MNTLVFDIETVPDTDSGRKLYKLDEKLTENDVADVMYTLRRQETQGGSDFLRLHLHRIVAISVVLVSNDNLSVWSVGDEKADEQEIIQRFFDGIEKYTPRLVSWNGGGFDLPVLHYRTLVHGISAPRYWESGGNDQNFRWNNYLNRYHDRHTDLMDILAGYQARANAPLTDIATMLGFPGKMGMSGEKVWDYYLDGKLDAIRNYCETDVLNTYLVYLRYELIRGNKTQTSYELELDRLRQYLEDEDRPHFKEFLQNWNAA